MVVMLVPGLDSMRTVRVAVGPVFSTSTWPGGPGSGTARTLGARTSARRERSRRRRTPAATPAAVMTAPASRKTSGPVQVDEAGSTWNDRVSVGAAA